MTLGMEIHEGETEEGNASHSSCRGDRRRDKIRRDDDKMEDEEEEKRTRNEEEKLEAASLEDSIAFTDTLIALKIIRAQFPKIERVAVRPFVLRSQLYISIKDRTQVDKELEALRKEEVLRIMNTGQDDHAIMFNDDYLKQVEAARIWIEAKHPDEVVVFSWFRSFVLPSKNQVGVIHLELCELLSRGGEVKDKRVSLLINAGLLTCQLVDSNSYWFLIPNIGLLLKSPCQGRKELESFFKSEEVQRNVVVTFREKAPDIFTTRHEISSARFDRFRPHQNCSNSCRVTCTSCQGVRHI